MDLRFKIRLVIFAVVMLFWLAVFAAGFPIKAGDALTVMADGSDPMPLCRPGPRCPK